MSSSALSQYVGLYVKVDQAQLRQDYGVLVDSSLTTKFNALKIAFPETKFGALAAMRIRDLGNQHTVTHFSGLHATDVGHLMGIGITSQLIGQVARSANYYAEKHYLDKKEDEQEEQELKEIANKGIEFTVLASVQDSDQTKNLAFNHEWQRNSNSNPWRY